MSVRSIARIWVERIPTSSTVPLMSPNVQKIADPDRLVGEENQPADQVFQSRPDGERDGQTTHTDTGEERHDIDTEILQAESGHTNARRNGQDARQQPHEAGIETAPGHGKVRRESSVPMARNKRQTAHM